ncbi:glycosyltransferase involved in cell wall biosynthesis [Methanolinea mesophila]|uniref:glycosyltransferase family 2 protein n=1 Tax=Methanolinea mesophila TaxID=547055 RepID=UPI001AE56DC2|nr:glycosyltransferase family 2 protein [Methanolinea mesophila]MBP1928351.1 glycosyltransferase involved in cell wall biosynthesis [Methanolinea mesophila]
MPETEKSSKSVGLIYAIIPAFNEEVAIGSVVLRTKRNVDRVLVIDDGSTDATAEIAAEAGAEVLRLDENRGKAYAVISGFSKLKEMHPIAVVMLDADGQHNPDEIPRVIQPILNDDADLVIGSRYLGQENIVPSYRKVGQKTLDLATSMSSGYSSTDSQSGFRAIGGKGIDCFNFTSEGYNLESDMIETFLRKGCRIIEVPITVKYDIANTHKKHPLAHGVDVMSHLFGLIGYKRPLISFGMPGLIFTGFGLGGIIYTFSVYYSGGDFHYIVFIMGIVGIILGLLLLTSALILNSLLIIIREQNMERP